MSLKATFSTSSNSTTVTGLYQWDYGQILEIESADLGSEIVEVHFACPNMSEAIVRSCAFSNGVGTVTIPDTCLEQSSTITAWVFLINGSQGHTAKTITLPIIARTRPSISRDIPAEISDKYTELITEVNEAVDALENGNITVAKATDANNANYAASAGNAATASYAISTEKAKQDGDGNVIAETYAKTAELKDGTVTVKKASCDGNGKNIAETYEPIAVKKETFTSGNMGSGFYTLTGMSRSVDDTIGCAGSITLKHGDTTAECKFSTLWQTGTSATVYAHFRYGTFAAHAVLELSLTAGKISYGASNTIKAMWASNYEDVTITYINYITLYYK